MFLIERGDIDIFNDLLDCRHITAPENGVSQYGQCVVKVVGRYTAIGLGDAD
jgi:hypothetical protein